MWVRCVQVCVYVQVRLYMYRCICMYVYRYIYVQACVYRCMCR